MIVSVNSSGPHGGSAAATTSPSPAATGSAASGQAQQPTITLQTAATLGSVSNGQLYTKMAVMTTSSKQPSSFPVSLSSIAPLPPSEPSQQQHHIVQRHPPALGVEGRLRMIQVPHPPQSVALPQNPVRPSALPAHTITTRASPPRLPQTPIGHVAAHPTTSTRVLHHAVLHQARPQQPPQQPGGAEQRAFSHIVINSKSGSANGSLPVLPRQPTTVVAPATLLATSNHQNSLLTPSALIPFPVSRASLQPPTNLLPHPLNATTHNTTSLAAMPANGLNHATLLTSKRVRNVSSQYAQAINGGVTANLTRGAEAILGHHHRLRQDAMDESENPESHTYSPRSRVPSGRVGIRSNHLSANRLSTVPSALQDHNYASRPPPTPPPPAAPSPPPVLPVAFVQQEAKVVVPALPMHSDQDVLSLKANDEVSKSPKLASNVFSAEESNDELIDNIAHEKTNVIRDDVISALGKKDSDKSCSEEKNGTDIEDAGVGPMEPLMQDEEANGSEGSNFVDDADHTALEADEDSITRCICNFLHDDGYMICCDKCSVWQHVVCMDLDRNNIPDEYMCEVCRPRPVDRRRARALQARRRTELMNNSSSSEEGILRELDIQRKSLKKSQRPVAKLQNILMGKKHKERGNKASNVSEKTIMSKERKRKAKREITNNNKKEATNPLLKQHSDIEESLIKRSKLSSSITSKNTNDNIEELEEVKEEDNKDGEEQVIVFPSKVDVGQQLRLWVERYSEAVTNHYAPELRARLVGNKLTMRTSELRPSVLNAPSKCHVYLQGNGLKVLLASTSVNAGTPVIECKGRFMLSSQFRSSLLQSKAKSPHPYVFFYKLADNLEICLDGMTYGNDSRFCRRSSHPNAELKHIIDKGSLHIFIVASKSIDKDQEVLLPLKTPVQETPRASALQSINTDMKQLKKHNSLEDTKKIVTKKSVTKQSTKKSFVGSKTGVKIKGNAVVSNTEMNETQVSVPKSIREDEEEDENLEPKPKSKLNSVKLSEVEEEIIVANAEDPNDVSNKGKPSPNKMGLPDNRGLIVGVNTINYDASSSVRNKAKSREERKMEMIIKAFEEMERAEQRKKEQLQHEGHGHSNRTKSNEDVSNTKQRRNSSKHPDSPNDLSSADESFKGEHKSLKRRGKRSTTNGRKLERRRSRMASGGSGSNPSETEASTTSTSTWDPVSAPVTSHSISQPFRFPKTKKSMMSEWLQESNEGPSINGDDDVSSHYLRGSRSPPGIATHLLRQSAMGSGSFKSVWSAKKRWLRQAISEDHSEDPSSVAGESSNGTCSSPTEAHVADYVTPLKKRRLAASFKDNVGEDEEDDNVCTRGDEHGSVTSTEHKRDEYPSSLKKKLLQNLMLEAVLDKAIEDISGHAEQDINLKKEELDGNKEGCKNFDVEQAEKIRAVCSEADSSFLKSDDATKVEKENTIKETTVDDDEGTSSTENFSRVKEEDNELSHPCHDSLSGNAPSLPSVLRAPDQSSPFKSFFQSDVSLEDFKVELKVDSDVENNQSADQDPVCEELPERGDEEPRNVIDETKREIPKESPKSMETSHDLGNMPTDAECDEMNPSVVQPTTRTVEEPAEISATSEVSLEATKTSASSPSVTESREECENKVQSVTDKPREKKKVSLADYKRRRKQAARKSPNISVSPRGDALLNVKEDVLSSLGEVKNDSSSGNPKCMTPLSNPRDGDRESDGPGTPTMDEDDAGACESPASSCFLPKLGSLPIFETVTKEKGEEQIRELHTKPHYESKANVVEEGPREDLTERLKKEFGLETATESQNCDSKVTLHGGNSGGTQSDVEAGSSSSMVRTPSCVPSTGRKADDEDEAGELQHPRRSTTLCEGLPRPGLTSSSKPFLPDRLHSSSGFPVPPPYPVRTGNQTVRQQSSPMPRVPPYPPPRHSSSTTSNHPRGPDNNRVEDRSSRSRFSDRCSSLRVSEMYVNSGSGRSSSNRDHQSSSSHYHRHMSGNNSSGGGGGNSGHRSGRDYRGGRHDFHHRHYRGSGNHRSRLQPGGSSSSSSVSSSSRGWSHK